MMRETTKLDMQLVDIGLILTDKAKAFVQEEARVDIITYPSDIIVTLLDENGCDWYLGEYDRDYYEKQGCNAFLEKLMSDLRSFDFTENALIANFTAESVYLQVARSWHSFAENLNMKDFETIER